MSAPKTIADLGTSQEREKPVVGRSMVGDDHRSLKERIRILEERLKAENEFLERGGYDYDGKEAWTQVMHNLGRR